MKKIFVVSIIIFTFCTILCSCCINESSQSLVEQSSLNIISGKGSLNSSEITEDQLSLIWEVCTEQFISDNKPCTIKDISTIARIDNVKEITIKNKKYYYNLFTHIGNSFVLIFDENNILYGSLFFNSKISYEDIKECKSFFDVKKLDFTLTDELITLNNLSAEMLLHFTDFEILNDEGLISVFEQTTIHYTDKGFVFIGYNENDVGELIITDIKPVDESVYDAVFKSIKRQETVRNH